MKRKTDPTKASRSEFTPEFLRWISITTLGTLLIVLVPVQRIYPHPFYIFGHAAVQAMGITVSMGLSEFSGHIPYISSIELFSMITALVLLYIIGPVLWLYSWRILKQKKETGTTFKKIARGWSLLFIIGGALTFRTVFLELTLTVGNRIVSASMENNQDVQRTKDHLIGDLNQVAFDANEYRILPKSLGGGSGSYEGFCVSPQQAKNDNGEISIIEARPQTITFLGVSSKNTVNSVLVSVDSIGRTCQWTFFGDFN